MRVLVGCEESGKVRDAFIAKGHEAYSCDLVAARSGGPHLQGDVLKWIVELSPWDLIILHPPCTALSLSGNRWYGKGMPRFSERLESLSWTSHLWEVAKLYASRVAMENPMSVLWGYIDAHVQYIQPWQFGHGETKKTGLALHNLPELVPTNIVDGREARIHKMPPGPNRARDRSETYQGIADAMADQWGSL